MLFSHFLIQNYQNDVAHPIWTALLHWLACFALTVAMWLVVGIAVVLFFAVVGG